MPKVDLTVTISVIIAICAIISPIITTILNNRHLYKIRKLDEAAQSSKKKLTFINVVSMKIIYDILVNVLHMLLLKLLIIMVLHMLLHSYIFQKIYKAK